MASTDGSNRIDPAGGKAPAAAGAAGPRTPVTSDDPEVLTAEIERTRQELAGTLDAIADKVSPKRVADRTKQQAGEKVAQAKETLSAKAATAKEVVVEKATSAKETATAKAATAKAAAGERAGAVTGRSDASPAALGSAASGDGSVALRPVRPLPATSSPLVPPAVAGAVAALVVALLVLRRRRR